MYACIYLSIYIGMDIYVYIEEEMAFTCVNKHGHRKPRVIPALAAPAPLGSTRKSVHIYIYIHIYLIGLTRTSIHTHIYIYIHIYLRE